MRMVLLVLAVGVVCTAQTPTAPGQPAVGPGGSNYPFASAQSFGPFNDSASGYPSYNYVILEPASPTPATLPVALFLHGYGADAPESYLVWLEQLTRKGYIVVWVQYDTNQPADHLLTVILAVFQDGLQKIRDIGQVLPQTDPAGVPIAVVVGHSAGAYLSFPLAALSWDSSNRIPPIRAIVAIEPGQGTMPTYDNSAIDPRTYLVVVVGDEDKPKRRCEAATIWQNLAQIPSSNKDFLEVISDARGTPQQLGNHYFPLTDTTKDTLPPPSVDDRDYNVTWKLSVGMFDCATRGADCDYALGHGSANQIGMGDWSNGAPVNPMLWVQDPYTYFAPDCASGGSDENSDIH